MAPSSRSPSPRTRRLRRAQGEKEAGKSREREDERHDGREKEKRNSREVERERNGEIGRDRDRDRERKRQGETDMEVGDKRRRSGREDTEDRRRAGTDDERYPRGRHERSTSPIDRNHRSHRRSPERAIASRPDEGSNARGGSEETNVKEDSVARMRAMEEALAAKKKEEPSFELSGKLAEETNRYRGDSQFLEDETTKNFARKVADHYSRRTNQTLEEREASPIIHLKKLNNWIKSVLIQLYARPDDAVLDLACGKGGDLIKWDKAKIGYYVGIDIAEGSIEDCRTRYNGDADHHQRRKKFSFPSRLLCGDCFEVELDKILEEDAPFDICSCQFAMHYSWTTEARARRALANVSALLRPGGVFIGTMPDANVIIKKLREAEGLEIGNSVYWIRFGEAYSQKKFKSSSPFGIEYVFHLEDAVDCPEWIVPFNVFKSLAEEYDLELVFVKNSHEFVHEYMKKPEFVELMRRLGALGDGNNDQSTLSADEWEAAYLYLSFVLRKRGESDRARRSGRRKNGKMNLSKDDVLYIDN